MRHHPPRVKLHDEFGREQQTRGDFDGAPLSIPKKPSSLPNPQYNPPNYKAEEDDVVFMPMHVNSSVNLKNDGEEGGQQDEQAGVPRSQSMTSLTSATSASTSGGADQFGSSFNAIRALQARTRSFLLGSVGATSLLGPDELEKCLPDRTVRLFVGTWNMNGKCPPRYLADFLLPQHMEYVPDILVINAQECFPERNEWEIRLQDTLGERVQ